VTETKPAPYVQRFGADAIDSALVAALSAAVAFPSVQGDLDHRAAVFGALYVGAFAVYEIVGVALWGKTLGRMATGVQVSSVGEEVRPIGWWRSFLRWLVKTLQPMVLLPVAFATVHQVLQIVVFLSIFIGGPLRRGVHDFAGSSWVVSTKSEAPGASPG
jgi:uncharacterized RDD family membrane protein YckC